MPTIIKPNTVLPKGGKLLPKPLTKSIGGWIELEYDARVKRLGLTWLRVKDGMGHRNDGEEWVADIPTGCLCVHDYQFRSPHFSLYHYSSFDAAIRGETTRHLDRQRETLCLLQATVENMKRSIAMLETAIKA